MDPNVVFTALAAALALGCAGLVIDQWRHRRRAYQLVWGIGLIWFGIAAGAEALGALFGWSEGLYRTWYLTGAVWTAAWLGLGTVYLLARTRFGYLVAIALLLAGLFTFLTQRAYQYPAAGAAPQIYGAVAVAAALAVIVLTARRDERWAHVVAFVVVGGTLLSAGMMALVQLPRPGFALDPGTGIPVGELFPGYLRLLTPFLNITGAFAMVLGALYSAYVFMPKRRVIRYSLRRGQHVAERLGNLLVAPVAIVVNLAASLPGAMLALVRGRLHSRVPATILIAVGAFIPSITSGLGRFGETSAHAFGLFAGITLIFIGFLVSIEVFADLRVPFTRIVLFRRRRGRRPAPDASVHADARAG